MLLDQNDRYLLYRQGRFLFAAFTQAHRVLSTCPINGGLRDDLSHIANHQSCEGVAHWLSTTATLAERHSAACTEINLPASSTALMSTAANMQCAVLSSATYAELSVQVAVTAGVLGNATRAADPAAWHEQTQRSVPVTRTATDIAPADHGSGTIVTLVFINQPCTPSCLVRAATIVTEGKSAALLDLRIPSLQSARLATGTGTDQLAIAAPLATAGTWERQWAGSHNTLGELLGQATHAAVTRCLLLQNGLCAELRRTVCGALGRYGCDESALRACAAAELSADLAAVFNANLLALLHDPQSAAAAYCLAESVDLAQVGILHTEVAQEALLNQAALLAAAVAVQPERFSELRSLLAVRQPLPPGQLAALAMVWGFARKWA